jgi:hypothetical protein
MTTTDLDLIVDDYLRQLETALGSLPTARRAQIITEIAEHVSQARSGLPVQDEASIRSILERVGTPSEIAASALTEGAPIAWQRGRQAKRRGVFAAGIAILLVVIGVVIYLAQSGSNVRVPNVVGSNEASAKQLLSGAGLQYSVALRPFGPEESGGPGTVIAQFPPRRHDRNQRLASHARREGHHDSPKRDGPECRRRVSHRSLQPAACERTHGRKRRHLY